jgi:drug/metabolite transporter (DMT)-like permease
MTRLIFLMGSVALGAIAQISLRYGVSERHRGRSDVWKWITLWGFCFAIATGLWLVVLRGSDISYAYPMLGMGYVAVSLLAKLLLKEQLSGRRWIAVLIITAGVVMVGVNR